MTLFERFTVDFRPNWTTILEGWRRSREQSPVITAEEITRFAEERLSAVNDVSELDLVVGLLSLDLHSADGANIEKHLSQLSELTGGDSAREIRKWRVILLEDVLKNLPSDPLYALIELTDFWASFDYPEDSPHEVQGRGNNITPSAYYQPETLERLIRQHRTWIQEEKSKLLW